MNLYSESDNYKLYQGNMLDMLEIIEPNSIDSIVTDPPYELNFMNKGWDNAGISFQKETWKKCYEVLKQGGYLLAFGGTRTYHRIASAIEDAGFEIRDCIMWLYGSGFPKSMNISKGIEAKEKYGKTNTVAKRLVEQNCEGEEYKIKQTNNGAMGGIIETTRKKYTPTSELAMQWQGWGTCLKPAYEPIIVARKPFKGSLVDNVIENGVGGLNIDECRVVNGRFPANVIHDGSKEVCSGMPNTKSGIAVRENSSGNTFGSGTKRPPLKNVGYEDGGGSASRYFYCAKASKKDRDEGLDEFEEKQTTDGNIRSNSETARKFGANSALRRNIHPTVKPTSLMQYLVRLVTPKCGTVLDPFMGSGSTGKAVMYENKERNANYKFIGIELTKEYLPIASARIRYVNNLKKATEKQTDIFDFIEE